MKILNRIWCLLIFGTTYAVVEDDWILHTPGGGPLDSRCPCMTPELCPRKFGESESDFRHFGQLPICTDSRQVRCCGASFRIEISKPFDLVGDAQETSFQVANKENNQSRNKTQQNEEKSFSPLHLDENVTPDNANISSTMQDFTTANKSFTRGHELETLNKPGELKSMFSELSESSKEQKSKNTEIQNKLNEDKRKMDRDSYLVFPWNMSMELSEGNQDVFLVYPDNITYTEVSTSMKNLDPSFNRTSEANLRDSSSTDNQNSTEIPILFMSPHEMYTADNEMPEYDLEALGSDYKKIMTSKQIQDDYDDDEDDGDYDDEDDGTENFDKDDIPNYDSDDLEDDSEDEEENTENDMDVEDDDTENHNQPHNHEENITKNINQNNQESIPKKSFVSENLKMRISQLSNGARRPISRHRQTTEGPPTTTTTPRTRTRTRQSYNLRTAGINGNRSIFRKNITNSSTTQRSRGPSYLNPKIRTLKRTTRTDYRKTKQEPLEITETDADRQEHTLLMNDQNKTNSLMFQFSSEPSNTKEDFVSILQEEEENDQRQDESVVSQIHLNEEKKSIPLLRQKNLKSSTSMSNPVVRSAPFDGTLSDSQIEEIDQSRRPEIFSKEETELLKHYVDDGVFGARINIREKPPTFQNEIAQTITVTSSQMNRQNEHNSGNTLVILGSPPSPYFISQQTGESDHEKELKEHTSTSNINVIGPIPKGFSKPMSTKNLSEEENFLIPPYPVQPETFRAHSPHSNSSPSQEYKLTDANFAPTRPQIPVANQEQNIFHLPHPQPFGQFRDPRIEQKTKNAHLTSTSVSPNSASFNQGRDNVHQQFTFGVNFNPQTISTKPPTIIKQLSQQQSSMFSTNPIETLQLHLPYINAPEPFRKHSFSKETVPFFSKLQPSPGNETTKAKTVSLQPISTPQKFLLFPNNVIKFQQNPKSTSNGPTNLPLRTQKAMFKPDVPLESDNEGVNSAAQLNLSEVLLLKQRDALEHSRQKEYTRKLQEYYQQLQQYYQKREEYYRHHNNT